MPASPFYSKLSRVVSDKMPNRADVATIKGIITNPQTGIKAEELKWSGILPWLDAQEGMVTKQAVLDYLASDGAVRLEEHATKPSVTFTDAHRKRYNELHRLFEKGQITQDQIIEHDRLESQAEAARSQKLFQPKFAQYQLPGGENYREVVLAMPKIGGLKVYDTSTGQTIKGGFETFSEAQRYIRDNALTGVNIEPIPAENYTSNHFPDVPNYVAHARLNDRVDAEGRPGTFIEEIQSDRHQTGREKGYNELQGWTAADLTADVNALAVEAGFRSMSDAETAAANFKDPSAIAFMREHGEEYYRDLDQLKNGIPDAPFRTTWPLQMFKRALAEAVAQGKQWIGWTTGDTQAERYDLSKQVDEIQYVFNPATGTGDLTAIKGSEDVVSQGDITPEHLEEFVGKDIAKRLMEQQGEPYAANKRLQVKSLAGADLKVGGEGMKGFYDTILPKEIGKYVKQWGAGVVKSQIPTDSGMIQYRARKVGEFWYAERNNSGSGWETMSMPYDTEAEAKAAIEGPQTPIWRVDITPQMKSGVEAGQALFSAPRRKASPEPAPAPDAAKAKAIKEAIATMPPMWREALELSMKGTPPEEIATRMNLSETAVGHILRTAQGRLRILLEAGEGKLKPTVRVEDEKVKAAGGRPDLAMSGKAAFAAVDQRRRTPEEVTHGEMEALAQRLFATDAAAAENLVVRWMDSGTTVLSTEGMPEAIKAIVAEAQARSAAEMLMTAAAKLLVTEKALAGGNAIQMARLIDLYRNTGTEQARALNMRYDPHATPEERAAMYLSEALLTPPEAMRNEIRRNPANKERILAAWAAEAEKLKEQLKAEGYDIDATFRELAKEKRLAEAAIPQEVKIPLAKASSKTRRLVKAVLEGMSWGDAAKAASLSFEAAQKAYMEFRDSINNAGVQAAQQAKEAMLRSAPVDFAAQLGLPEWLENASPDYVPVKTETTEALKKQRTKKKAGGEFDLKDPVAGRRVITKISAAKSTAFDKISEYWRASILSGPQTHVVNVVSGVTFGLYESTFKKLATATQADIARMFGMKPDAASLSDIPGMLSAVLPSIKQAFANGLRAWKEDSRVFDAYAMQVLDDQGGVFKEQSHAAIKGKKGAIIRSPFRLMGMADEFVKSFFTRIEVVAQARQIARNENLTGEAFRLRIAELMEPGSLAWERALGGAKRITFQNEEVSVNGAPIKLGGPLASGSRAIDAIDGAANLIKRTKKGDFGGLLRGLSHFIFPFVDTPTNIFKMGVQMSPVGGLLSVIDAVRYYNLRRKGNNEQAQKIYNAARAFDDLANQIVAWGFILALSELVKPGDDDEETPWITGTLPWRTTAPGEREIAYRVAPPQSIRIGGQWISYKRLDPFASALAFTVDAIKEFGSGRPIDETWGNVGLNMMRNMQDKTFLQGVSDLFNAINDPERFGTKWAVNIATGFVPNLIRQPVRTADPLIRESDIPNDMGLWDALARRVGYSVLPQSAMPAIDVWGREQAKNTGTGGPNTDWMLRLFSPADMKDADGVDYLDVALLRYNMAHDKPFGVAAPSREIQKTINGKPVRVSLDDAEYDDMARKAGKAARAAIGDRFKGRDLTENDVELIKDIISRSQGVYRDAAFTSAFQKRGLAATSK